jgi:hypothetical protein
MTYPTVFGEIQTVEEALSGRHLGIARYGDGDFNIMRGGTDRYHKPCPKLAAALAETLHSGSSRVLNCLIPPPLRMKEGELAYQRWVHYLEMNAGLLPFLSGGTFGSSNISRMDSCPHLHTTSYWNLVARLWRDKDICLVSGTARSLTSGKMMESPGSPRSVAEVTCKPRDNFDQLYELLGKVVQTKAEVTILCAGLVTRPLVHKLAEAGMYAFDVGHFGLWFNEGQPIPLQDCPR